MAHLPLTILARQAFILDELKASADTKQRIAGQCTDTIIKGVDMLIHALNQKKKILLCGNGGSAADAQHLATEFVIRMNPAITRPGIPAIALTTDSSMLTSIDVATITGDIDNDWDVDLFDFAQLADNWLVQW